MTNSTPTRTMHAIGGGLAGGLLAGAIVGVRMNVDEPGGDDASIGLDDAGCVAPRQPSDLRDPPAADADIGVEPRIAWPT